MSSSILLVSIGILGLMPIVACGLFFQPSWANGLPGVPQAKIMATVAGGLVFATIVALCGLCASACYLFAGSPDERRTIIRYYSVAGGAAVIIGGLAAASVFAHVFNHWDQILHPPMR